MDMHLISVEAEARRYCDRHEIRDPEACQRVLHQLKYEAFMKEIEPTLEIQRRWASTDLSTKVASAIVNRDGKLEWIQPELRPETKAAIQALDKLIILAAQRWGLDYCPVPAQRRDERT